MERKKYILINLIVILLSFTCNAQISWKNQIYYAYLNKDMNKWASIINEMEKEDNLRGTEQKLELAGYYYGIIGFLIDIKDKQKAQHYILKGESLVDRILDNSPQNATANAFKGSFIAFKIALNKYKAITLGPESMKYIDKSFALNPYNIQAITDKAYAYYHAPRIFGGDKHEAIKLLLKSISIMEQTNHSENNWLYLNVLVSTAKAYEATNQPLNAKSIYEKALQREPRFLWVKNHLYPNLLRTL